MIQTDKYTIYCGDAFDILSKIPDKSIDCIITDPPYWTLNIHRKRGTTTRLGGHQDPNKRNGWFETIDEQELWELMNEFWRVLKKNTHCYMMCDGKTLGYVLNYGNEMDWRYVKPLVWDKLHPGMGYHYRCQHEYIVMMDKGTRRLNDLGIADVFRIQRIRGYPTQKPVELMEIFVKQSTQPGEIILDPFMGSGTTGVAALKHGRKFIGCDISQEAFNITHQRLEEL